MPGIFIYIINVIKRRLQMRYIPLFLAVTLFAQDIDNPHALEKPGTTGSIGTVTINGKVYNQLSLRPEIPIGKLGIGLDVYLYFNDEGMYWESWDFSTGEAAYRSIIDKIYYLRWGQPGDDLYFMAGALPSATLGQGILVNNYSNIMEYPQVRQIGLKLQAKVAGVGMEILHSNFKTATPGVMGARVSYSVLPKLTVGASYVTDLNQFAGLPDADGDGYPDYYDFYPDDSLQHDGLAYAEDDWAVLQPYLKDDADFNEWFGESKYYNEYNPAEAEKDNIYGMAFDVTYALNKKVTLYSQAGLLMGEIVNDSYSGLDKQLGWGLVPLGVRTKLGPVDMLAEYRMSWPRFIFNYWDRAYDVNRVSVNTFGVVTRESQLYKYGKLNGFYTHANMNVMNLLNMGIGYQNMGGEIWDADTDDYKVGESNQTFIATVGINPALIPKVGKAEAFYQQSNVPDPFEFEPNVSTIWGYNVGVEVSSGVMLVYQARTTYISDLDNPGDFKPVESIQIETQFIF